MTLYRTPIGTFETWEQAEIDAELNAKFQIYNSLVKAATFTTEAEGKLKYEMEANKVNFAYVAGLYSTIKDSQVKVTDAEIVDFMKKNEKKYKADETREVEYVLIEDKASKEDENEVKTKITALLSGSVVYNQATGKNDTLPGFKNATNTVDFVNSNSDVPYDSSYVAKKDLPAIDADQLYNLAPGAVYGPYKFGSYYCISKSLGRKAGVNAKASHILISYQGTQVPNQKENRTKEEAKAKAEKLLGESESFYSSSTSTPTIELLYLDAPAAQDKKTFEKNAKVFVNKKILTEINTEIEAGTKSKNKTNF
mgnify:CR=1 FL=1